MGVVIGMGMVTEFKEFAMKGNVVDMAVGIVIGAAFGKIVSSFVDDVLMPPLGLLLGGVDFSEMGTVLKQGAGEAEAVVLKWGAFVQAVIDFLIIAFAIFLVIKGMNSLRRKQEEEPEKAPDPSEDIVLLREIRDELKKA